MRRPVVAVIGNGDAPPEVVRLAEEVGQKLVDAGFRLVTGGLGGVMEAAARGARRSQHRREGDVLGILPGTDPLAANSFTDIVIPSGLGIARNVLVVASADAVIALGGGSGTLSEMAIAWQLGRPLVAVELEGWSGRLAGERIDERRNEPVARAATADEAVDWVRARLSRAR